MTNEADLKFGTMVDDAQRQAARAIDDIKSKYGDLYILEREENGRDN